MRPAVVGALTGITRVPGRSVRITSEPLRLLAKSRLLAVGLAICVPVVAVAILAPAIAPYEPLVMDVRQRLQPPSAEHVMGTDQFGRDMFSRVIYGARVSVQIGVVSTALGLWAGFIIGVVSGYVAGVLGDVLMRLMDALIGIPAILLGLVLVAILGTGLTVVTLTIAVIRVPIFARTIHGLVLTERERDYVEAARAVGQRETRVLLHHIVPNIISPIIVLATSYFASAIVLEASLSFLGLGVVPPDVSWGTMLNESREYMQSYPWAPVFPGLAMSLSVLGFNLLGDGVRDLLDPRLRRL